MVKQAINIAKKKCALSSGDLPLRGLYKNSLVMITNGPNMTLAVDRGPKAIKQNTSTMNIDVR